MWSFEIMILVQSAVAWACLILALRLVEPPYRDQGNSERRVQITKILRHLLRGDPV